MYRYIAEQNADAAEAFLADIGLKIGLIAETGFTGVPRPEFGPGIRALPYRDRCIYFRVTATHFHVVRVLHGRQDLSSEDFPESEN